MVKEFNWTLSEKMYLAKEPNAYLSAKDVKEFIKKLKEEMGNCTRGLSNKDLQMFYITIDKLAGKFLI